MFGFGARCQDKLALAVRQTTAFSAPGLPAVPSLGPGLPQGQRCPAHPVGWAPSGCIYCFWGEAPRPMDVLSRRLPLGCLPACQVTKGLAQVGVEGPDPSC